MTTIEETDIRFMRMALEEARAALNADEVPIGAVIVSGGQVIGRGHNMTETLGDVTAHAEMLAITAATQTLGGKYLDKATIYVTVEPCLMCAGAIAWSQISRIVYGTGDPKRGYTAYISPQPIPATTADSPISATTTPRIASANHKPKPHTPFHPKATITTGILARECANLMRNFFRSKR